MNFRRVLPNSSMPFTDEDQRIVNRLRGELTQFSRGHRVDPASVAFAVRHLPKSTVALTVDQDTDKRVSVEMIEIAFAPPPPSRTQRSRLGLVGAAAALAVVLAGSIGVIAYRDRVSAPAAGGATGCDHAVVTSSLPTWAQSGFSADALVDSHVTGAHGNIVGVLFADPLTVPPRSDQANKILWISRIPVTDGQPLKIDARLDGAGTEVTRTVTGGPGPSTLDLPTAGCWTLTLSWSGNQDTVNLPYVAR